MQPSIEELEELGFWVSTESKKENQRKMMTWIMMDEANKKERCCSECKTTKTPMWRGGPAGPKSLCNACGIRYRKHRRSQLMGISNSMIHGPKTKNISQSSSSLSSTSSSWQSSSLSSEGVVVKKQRRLREEEQAAFCLLALSCGSVFA